MKTVSINVILAIYSAVMTFFTFTSLFFTFPAIQRIDAMEPRVSVLDHVSDLHGQRFTLVSSKLDNVQSALTTVTADLRWIKQEIRNNKSTRRERQR